MTLIDLPELAFVDLAPKQARPVLKWVGGKTQLISELKARAPKAYGKYIEPFFGGGALFFSVAPRHGVIADSNPELINLYRAIQRDVGSIAAHLAKHENTAAHYYKVRALKWQDLDPAVAAARTIFLNRTCFNGLYRVNRKGEFNTPFGRYKNPKILDEANLELARQALRRAEIILGDYRQVLKSYAVPGDFIFLDPPYLPVSKYADFKRYTKEQFYEEDHRELAAEVRRLQQLGCHVLLTNSNHPLVHELYGEYSLDVMKTRRNVSSSAATRSGEDVLVVARPMSGKPVGRVREELPAQVGRFPATRYMGSKRKLLGEIWNIASSFKHTSVLDLFSGSGIVSYLFKAQGKRVIANDHMASAFVNAQAMVANARERLSYSDAERLISTPLPHDDFVSRTFEDIYFSKADLETIDAIRTGIKRMRSPSRRALARAALMRACMKKRARGIFTYVGERYDDGRRDLKLSIAQHFIDAAQQVSDAVFDSGVRCEARWGDSMDLNAPDVDLVYMDPPYFSRHSDNEYVRRYHFVEGLARDWKGVEIQHDTLTRKFKSYPTPFSTHQGAVDAFDRLFRKFRRSTILVSYSSNSLPTKDEMVGLLAKHKSRVEVVPVDHRYSFGNRAKNASAPRNTVKEYLFVGY